MSEKEKALSFAGIKQMNKTAYYKLFKKPVVWKKATAMICIVKHKFTNGKAPLVCIPYRKKVDALKAYKEEVKKELSPNFFLLTTIQLVKQANGKTVLEITPLKGNATIDTEVATLFQRMKMEVVVKSALVAQEVEETSTQAADSAPSNTTDSIPQKTEKKEDSKDFLNFQKQMSLLKPELKKLAPIVANIKKKALTATCIDTAIIISDHIKAALLVYKKLPKEIQTKHQAIKKQLDDSLLKVEKVLDASLLVDSQDPKVMAKQKAQIITMLQKELQAIGIDISL